MKWMVTLIVVAVVLAVWAVMADASEYVYTGDTSVNLRRGGSDGIRRIDLAADDTANVLFYRFGAEADTGRVVADTFRVYLRDWMGGRSFNAADFGWTAIDSMDLDVVAASEVAAMEVK